MKRPIKPEHEAFCVAYTTPGPLCGVAYKAYAHAYNIDIPLNEAGRPDTKSSEYKVSQASSSRLLLHPDVQERIKEIYLEFLTDTSIDARMAEIAKRGRDADSLQAIKIYNDLKQRVTKKVDVTTAGRPLGALTDDELRALAAEELAE